MRSRPEPYRVVFVCTGNTCRSPLAEALARRELERRGWTQVEVSSAGTSALPGSPASEGSIRAAARGGLDLSGHEARPLAAEMIEAADVVLAMSAHHMARVLSLGGDGKVDLLTRFAGGGDGGVPDPFGGDDAVYRETYEVLEALVVRALDRLERIVDP